MSGLLGLYAEFGVDTPHQLFTRLREERPITQVDASGSSIWLVTRYEDVRTALGDQRLSPRLERDDAPVDPPAVPLLASMGSHLLRTDGGEHRRLRQLMPSVFTTRRIEALRPAVERMTARLLDRMAEVEAPDVMRDLATQLPMQVLCELLGLPQEDGDQLREWSNSFVAGIGRAQSSTHTVVDFVSYLREALRRKRDEPDDGLISAMISARLGEDRFSEDELTSMAFLLIIAGYETTVNLIGNGTHLLLTDPGLADRLRADPATVRAAVEEFLRFEGPVPSASFRIATQSLELAGQQIREGELVMISLMSANRDHSAFPDPHRLDVDRPHNAHLAFGYGIHYCLGAPLARLEGEVVFTQLSARFPELGLADPALPARWRRGLVARGLTELPVRFAGSGSASGGGT